MAARQVLSLALLGAALAGCGAAPSRYHSQLEIPEGPGLFSGEKGAFVFQVGGSAKEAPKDPAGEPSKPGEYEEFQRWKRERAASEQREFQEWREYQEWKKQHGR